MGKYFLAKTLDEALSFLEENGDRTRIIAGGTDLLVLLRDGKAEADYLLDITRIPGLGYIKDEANLIKVGTLATHNDVAISPIIREKATVLAEASSQVGSPQVRNMGTVVGNVANASPAADATTALVALDAEVIAASKSGQRTVKVSDLLVGPGQTKLSRKELITELRFQGVTAEQGSAFLKLSQRRALAIGVVNTAVLVTLGKGKKRFEDARIGVGAVAPTPMRARRAEKKLIGQIVSEETIKQACQEAASEVTPIDDIRGSVDYRCQMTRVLVGRAIRTALSRIK